jgi:hypothetical protein
MAFAAPCFYIQSQPPQSQTSTRGGLAANNNNNNANLFTQSDAWVAIVSNLLLGLLVFGLSASVDVAAFREKLKKK